MVSNGITARGSFHRIRIAGKKSLVKRAPDSSLFQAEITLLYNIESSGNGLSHIQCQAITY